MHIKYIAGFFKVMDGTVVVASFKSLASLLQYIEINKEFNK